MTNGIIRVALERDLRTGCRIVILPQFECDEAFQEMYGRPRSASRFLRSWSRRPVSISSGHDGQHYVDVAAWLTCAHGDVIASAKVSGATI
jgi:hypothetical protein